MLGARHYPKSREQIAYFYAQAWLTAHYLHTAHLFGEERQLEAMGEYLRLIRKNRPWAESFRSAFSISVEELEQRIKNHRKRVTDEPETLPAVRVSVAEVDPSILTKRKLEPSEAAKLLGQTMLRMHRDPRYAERLLDLSLRRAPDPAAQASRALALARDDRLERATALIQEVAGGEPSDLTILLARAEIEWTRALESDPVDIPLLESARASYRKAIEVAPSIPAGYVGLGRTYVDRDEDPSPGIEALEKARGLAPMWQSGLLALGKLYVAAGNDRRAYSVLMHVLRWGVDDPAATEARELLVELRERVLEARRAKPAEEENAPDENADIPAEDAALDEAA